MKKILLLTKTLLAVALLCVGQSAWADDVNLDPVGVFTWTNAPTITYDADATSWTINQGGVSGGKIGRYAGPYAIVKFDASSVLAGKTLLTATLDFDITAGAYNSSINIAQLSDASFTPSTVTTETFDATATQFQAGDWSTKNTTTHFSYDVKARVEENNVLAFAIFTNTGREQTLKNVQLKLSYSDVPVAKYNYSLKAVTSKAVDIKTLAEGEEYEVNDVTLYFPYMFYNESTLYTTATTPYSVTVDKDNASKTVTYAEASSDIVAYMEGEASSANSGEDASYSNGKHGYAAGNKTQEITTLAPGKYRAVINLVSNPNRSVIIRNTAISDVNSNTIVALPIDKNSAAGTYTSDEFTITEETTIGFSGYTTDNKTNQSANIDYIYIVKTGEVATIGDAGWATLYTPYALDFSGVDGLEAYTATCSDGIVTLTKVDNVPANTGVVLKGAADTYSIPVTTSSSTAQGHLKGSATEATAYDAFDGYTLYVLTTVNDGANVQFNPVNEGSIAAGKAFLKVSGGSSSARALRVVFDGITGVDNVEAAAEAKAQDGKFIENGKIVIVKNGVKYNAAGQQVK